MENKLADTLPAEKIRWQAGPSVSTFNIQMPVNGEKVCFLLQLFCGNPSCNGKGKYSYSIIGKIEGVSNLEAHAEIISDYGGGIRLTDRLNFECGRFIFSNLSFTTVFFHIQVRLKGNLSTGAIMKAEIGVHLKYNLRQFLTNGIQTRYTLTKVAEPYIMTLR